MAPASLSLGWSLQSTPSPSHRSQSSCRSWNSLPSPSIQRLLCLGWYPPLPSSSVRNPLNPWISMSCSIPDPATLPHSPLEAKIPMGASLPSLPSQISAVRLPREPTNPERLKGFGYAEFEDIDSLFQALSLNEEVSPIPASKSTSQGLKGLQGPGGGFGHWSDGKRANGFQLEEGRVRWDMGREFPAQHSLPAVVPSL